MAEEILNVQPSLLGLIVSEVEKMSEEEKRKLLVQLRKENILAVAKSLDAAKGAEKPDAMTDEEADNFISQQRKARYEQFKA